MKSPLKFPGGKGPLVKWIVGMMPSHIHYVEPFFGAGSVLFAKDPEGVSEVANDLNGDLMNFWRVMQEPQYYELFYNVLQWTPVSESRWRESCKLSIEGPVERALDFFVRIRQSLAARGQVFTTLSRTRTRRGMNEQASAWWSAVEGLPAVHDRLKRVVILCRPALEVIESQDGPDTLFYLDPPYLHETRTTTGEYGAYEMAVHNHVALIELLTRVEGKFLLSGYHSPLYDNCAQVRGWTCHEKEVANHASHEKVKGKEIECVWTNF